MRVGWTSRDENLTTNEAHTRLNHLYCSGTPWFSKESLQKLADLFHDWENDQHTRDMEMTDLTGRSLLFHYETDCHLPPLDPDDEQANTADSQFEMM